MRQFGPTERFLLKTGSVHLKVEPGGEDVCSFSGLQKLFFGFLYQHYRAAEIN